MHVLSRIYRGSGYLDIGESRCERHRGVATWIPAGLKHITGLRENSISLPLGSRPPLTSNWPSRYRCSSHPRGTTT
ncbi:hypothetical protein [Kibdelosporangium phytohabitans]|uniref:Uncharacterized protein n=1 Tax=Kibdelosporangium phytohabitans TaxID=860235 RepID=A0A0N9HUA1_9PSEU|nr:hypothetical protein [Kibdelosporangium phytohabitans]ALG06966.1 hypothetical protein AOZ06_08540 [Kibdelosporangium phytohabitans]MBE1468247.1 hypothetical protein [Kibdelosporangium phytohabitans]